uniref:Uncharacterized protein n=1 Tax=Rhizophagus irregularis (strain DAOM 181602 / DAOM 197198 / MUCL 43194) TaxID=747089 RepID=U9TQC9_RHIID
MLDLMYHSEFSNFDLGICFLWTFGILNAFYRNDSSFNFWVIGRFLSSVLDVGFNRTMDVFNYKQTNNSDENMNSEQTLQDNLSKKSVTVHHTTRKCTINSKNPS